MSQEISIILDLEYKHLIITLKQKYFWPMYVQHWQSILSKQSFSKAILEKQQIIKWRGKFLECVSKDLTILFPAMRGFSRSNVYYMKQFADFHSGFTIIQQSVGQLPRIQEHLLVIQETQYNIKVTVVYQ